MCLAVPGLIIQRKGDQAEVDFQGNRASVSVVLTPEAQAQDWVLVHAGFAITQIDERDARETWDYLNQLDRTEYADVADEAEAPHG